MPASNRRGSSFEKEIEATFMVYENSEMARMMMMPVPTRVVRPAGKGGGPPLRVSTGKAPFDVVGYFLNSGRMIGAELKASARKNSLPIVAPGKHGDGLQFHQLDALAGLAMAGGKALLVWSNGGEVGVLEGDRLVLAWRVYCEALKSERSNKTPKKGAKSLLWELFKRAEHQPVGVGSCTDWLLA